MEASIVISGGGIIGNYISLRLSKSNISSVIIEKSEESFSNGEGIRTLTLNDQSLMMLKDIGINPLSSPINEINVMDGEGTGKIQFSSKDISTNSLSHVVVFNDLRDELLDLCKEKTIFNSEVEAIQNLNDELDPEILISNGETIKAKLLAGCDGRNSNVAKIASLSNQTKDYLQTAVTFIVDVKDAEEEMAYQVFSERGIFALMPMPKKDSIKNRHTVVWSINNSELKDISIENYVKNNLPYFESKLSLSMSIDSQSLSFRLSNHYFENYISGPVVLIGDAAHSIHPLAGQGINLGFADADIFCEEIINSYNKGFALNDKTVLKRYEIRRKGMNLVMLKSMDFFVNFFNTNNLYLRLLRNWGLNSVNKTKFIKTFFIKHASGLNKF
jgi:ubiquinone biosynthesis UbiH/UbiF/VisC/COQ6 family hydroxylase